MRGGPAVPENGTWRLRRAHEQVTAEIAALRAARGTPHIERAWFLADLGSRLTALIAWLAGDPATAGRLAGLSALACRLRDCDQGRAFGGAELDALWADTVAALSEFAEECLRGDEAAAHPAETPPARRSAFWQRPV